MNTLKLIKVLGGVLLITLISLSCSNNASKYDATSESILLQETGETADLNSYELEKPGVQSNERYTQTKDVVDLHTKIIKNANCKIKVHRVEEVTKKAKQLAVKYKGYVSDERFTNTNYSKENRFTIRVPQHKFDVVLDEICELAEFVDYKNITTIDVSEEYVDVTSRLKTKLEVKERYETILRNKAKTVEDVLKTEDKLKQIQEEIESAKGRLNYLSNRVAYSTIQLDIYETVVPESEPSEYKPGFINRAKKGFLFGWSIIESFILLLFYIWPFIVLIAFVFMYFKWGRKINLKK
ncbi:DUF4349 domain-containing protein [Aquimarina sp. AU474]|uniref:DUF4349 domain-containing protein n=1 Tax=Aquimarina sp. AU474 TaxID=2108529 RepID=UPI000D68AF6C|nr:DUF4349 domain-containing protein [Aquimarina sp. AU474]